MAEQDARADWQARVGQRVEQVGAAACPSLPPPLGLRAEPGRGQVTLRWQPVDGAIGYLVHRRATPEGPFVPIDHGGGDVLAVPHGPYVDTTAAPGESTWYAVASVACVDHPPGPLSGPVGPVSPRIDGSGRVEVHVDAGRVVGELQRPWRPMIGADHLAQLFYETGPGGRPVGAEFAEALRLARDELGVRAIRAHGVLSDDPRAYREVDGVPRFDFTWADAALDRVLETGLRPIVELSFMPPELASDATATVFDYRAIVSPPHDWDRWADLIRAFVAHLVERYGLDEVRDHWGFEVWNEANLSVFWSGSREEYLRLYETTARAVRSVDPGLRVGGPATAAAGWIDELLAYVVATGAPIDFLSTHTYGNLPLDLRAATARHGLPNLPIWWTEWGVSPTHFAPVNDSVFGAPFVLHGMKSAHGRIDALAYWVISDHFEELGRPPRLFHGGFGLLTVGNLRKPRYWALAMLERLGPELVECDVEGDGAGGLVDAWATRRPDGSLQVLVWNGTLDQSKVAGDTRLARTVGLRIDGLRGERHELSHWRIDEEHSNVQRVWQRVDGGDWPDEAAWAELRRADRLEELEPKRTIQVTNGRLVLEFELPMPGVSLLEMRPL